MAKRKKSVALFELIGGNAARKELNLPEWAQRRRAADSASAAAPRQAVRLRQPAGFGPSESATAERPAPAEPLSRPQGAGPVRIHDGRLHLSLGYVSCLVAALGLIILMVAFYKLGQANAGGSVDAKGAAGAGWR